METFLSPLNTAEEKACLKRLKEGDQEAKEELILHNMRLVAHVAKRYAGSEEDPQDLLSIGTIGLIKAVLSFDSEYGSRFATYAIRCIDNEMLMYFRSKKKTRGEVSMFEPIGTDKEGNQIQLADILECEEIDVTEELEKNYLIQKMTKHLKEQLDDREYAILTMRYGVNGQKEKTQREIAKSLHISRSYVSRIEKKALEKMRKFLSQ
ncbi:MAG: RNA polymerase sporulation sigma factor SigK [Agathobacter sp.]